MPVLNEMTASTSSLALLKSLIVSKGQVTVPKLVLVKDEETNQLSQIPTDMLIPGSQFYIEDIGESFIVTRYSALDESSCSDVLNTSFQSDTSDTSLRSELQKEDHSSDSDDSETAPTNFCSEHEEDDQGISEVQCREDEMFEEGEQIENASDTVIRSILHLLPSDFHRGEDGLGSKNVVQKKSSLILSRTMEIHRIRILQPCTCDQRTILQVSSHMRGNIQANLQQIEYIC